MASKPQQAPGGSAPPVALRGAPATADDLTDLNVRGVVALENKLKSNASIGERVAGRVGAFCGSLNFVWIHLVWFGAWVFVNSTLISENPPDPFPFTFLTLCVSLEAILLAAVILISQNQETRISRQRARLDLQINLLAEQENTKILTILNSIAAKVGVDLKGDPDLASLLELTRPDRVLKQIEQASDQIAQQGATRNPDARA